MLDPETATTALNALLAAASEVVEGIGELASRPLPVNPVERSASLASLHAHGRRLSAILDAAHALDQ